MGTGRSRRREIVFALVVVLVVAVAVFVMTYERSDPGDENTAPTQQDRSFPPGTFTAPPGDEQDCGEYTLQFTQTTGDPQAEEHTCILSALANGTPAVLVHHYGTTEGDPIREQFRVLGANRVEFTMDTTRDNFGGQAVTTVECAGLEVSEYGLLQPTLCPQPVE